MPRPQADPAALANYTSLQYYTPLIGDYVVWSRWFSTWHGVVTHYDIDTCEVHIIFAGMPYMLFTMDDSEKDAETKKIKLQYIKDSSPGAWAILRHEQTSKANVWYI